MSDVEQNPNEKDNTIELDQINYCIPTRKRNNSSVKSKDSSFLCILLKIVFSAPGLVIIVVFYSIMGALLFPILEAPATSKIHYEIAKSREDCLKELWTITGEFLFYSIFVVTVYSSIFRSIFMLLFTTLRSNFS